MKKGKTQLGIALQYPLVYAYVTLYFFFKSGKVNGGGPYMLGQSLKRLLGVFLSLVTISHHEDPRQLSQRDEKMERKPLFDVFPEFRH